MRYWRWKALFGFFLAAVLSVPLWGAAPALPGTLNYVEGQTAIGAQPVSSSSIGSTELQPGQSLQTEAGKAEVLLTPGVFVRLGDHSSVTMISPSLINTEVQVDKGQVMVEADQLHRANDISVEQDGATAQLLKTGLYDFDADQNRIRVFDGQVSVQKAGRQVKVKSGRELSLVDDTNLKARKFDKKAYEESDLYRFSSLRSDYLAQANSQAARIYVANGWWGGPGWWWNPWFGAYTWVPVNGAFFSPFGWGFYSPVVWGGFYGYPFAPGRPRPFRPGLAGGPRIGGLHGGPAMGGFHGGGAMGGGFHGGRG